MTDKYIPSLANFSFSVEEQAAIDEAMQTDDPWGWKTSEPQKTHLQTAKNKTRDYHLTRHGHRCCYCRVNLFGAGHFMIDREHILPKGNPSFRHLSYTMWNLGTSCKRCNMEYKKTKEDFIIDPNDDAQLKMSDGYRILHPNFDKYDDHIKRNAQDANNTSVVTYTVLSDSPKGAYTHEYFNLEGLEIGSFDKSQGKKMSVSVGVLGIKVRALAQRIFGSP